jgi:hypothetical protein
MNSESDTDRLTEETTPSLSLTLRLEGFVSQAVLDESARMGVSGEELASFSILYYLADVDSGRIARRPSLLMPMPIG